MVAKKNFSKTVIFLFTILENNLNKSGKFVSFQDQFV
jgi:hypothetical protein